MSVQTLTELNEHFGHDVEVTRYVNKDNEVMNVAIECTECYEVLVDYDREES